jgi:hypothetical protein
MLFNATFNNISTISWQLVLLVNGLCLVEIISSFCFDVRYVKLEKMFIRLMMRWIKWKAKKYRTVGTVPKSNRKIRETEVKSIIQTHTYTFYWWRKREYPEKTTDLSQVTEKNLSLNVVSSTSRHEQGSNSQLQWW